MKIKLVDMVTKNERVISIPGLRNITLGRMSSDVEIEDKEYTYSPEERALLNSVSKTHCIIHLESSNPYVVDCNSRKGTYANGVLVQSSLGVVLEDRDILRLGDYGFQVLYQPQGTRSRIRLRRKELPETIDYIDGNYRLDLGEVCNNSGTVRVEEGK